jgi:TonB-linked SusC/RagA family outer membrane protein
MKLTGTLILLFLLSVSQAYPKETFAQNRTPTDQKKTKKTPVIDALKKVTEVFGTQFVYDRGLLEKKFTTYDMQNLKGKSVEDVLKGILYPNDFVFLYVRNNYYTIVSKDNVGAASDAKKASEINPVSDSVPKNGKDQIFKGSVRDATTSQPLSGVTVSLKGTSTGTTTDNAGNFTLAVRNGQKPVLLFSNVGYEPMEVTPGKTDVNISLSPANGALSEVVVVGYGTVKKRDLTTSISTISSEDIMKTPITTVEQALQGNAAGVLVVNTSAEPGGDISIRVRGGSSIKADNAPLLVIDGFTSDQTLSSLNPSDIKSIEILKDAGATAIYGSRGANGVILVTTKSGVKGKPVVTIDTYYGFQELRRKLPLLTSQQLYELANDAKATIGLPPVTTRPDTMTTDKDWQALMFHRAPQLNGTVSVSGGDNAARYYVSVNYLTQDGLIISSDYSRAAIRSNVDFNFSKSVSAGIKLNLSQTSKHGIQVGDNGSILRANSTNPTDKGLLDPSGSFYIDPSTGDPITTSPLANAQETTNERKELSLQSGAYLQFRILKNFTLRSEATINPSYRLENYYFPNSIKGDKVSSAYEKMTRASKWSNANSLSYAKTIKQHSFSLLAGQEITSSFNNNFQAGNTDFSTDVFEFYNLGSGNGLPTVSSAASEYKLLSYFGRATYNYSDRYLFSFTYRADGSSKFGEDNKWGYFPSGSFAWRVSNEPFFKNINFFNDLKFRVSYGVNGSDRISPYSSQALYATRATSIGGVLGNGYMIDKMANKDLRWEKTAEFDAGIDFSVLKNRISFTADYYLKNTTDLLLDYALPAASGYTTVSKNIGSVENRGLEFAITSRNVSNKSFSWTTSFNIAVNRNKVTDLGGPTEISAISNSSANNKFGNVVLIKVGQPLGVFYGYKTDGLYQTQEEADKGAKLSGMPVLPGVFRYVDMNNDGKITDADKTILGNPQPNWNGGMTNNFAYKNFDFSIFIIFQKGNSIMNTSFTKLMNFSGDNNQLAKVLDRWRPANELTGDPGQASNTIPRAYKGYPDAMSDFYIEDGSYLRVKTLTLGYNLNNKRVSGVKLPDLRFYVSATNLFTLTKYYGGYDPEVSYLGSGSVGAGIDNGSYPTSKMYLFGIKAKF